MAAITTGTFQGHDDFRYLSEKAHPIHYLRKPTGYSSGMAWGNLGYQMQYSVEALESQLEEEGSPHVLQINFDWQGDDWENPTHWRLYADGYEIASGDGRYAKSCFEASAECFRDTCRRAVDAANLPAIDAHDYYVLARARAIAAAEPFDNGSRVLGGKAHRIY